jgi:hypothetical protein
MTYTIADEEAMVAKAKGRPKMLAGLLDAEKGASPFPFVQHVPLLLKNIPSRTIPLASDDDPSNLTLGRSHHLRFAPPPPRRPSKTKKTTRSCNCVGSSVGCCYCVFVDACYVCK